MPGPGRTRYEVQVQGADVLADHFLGLAMLWDEFAPALLDATADVGVREAKELVAVRTGATRDSINKQPGVYSRGGFYIVEIGPTTPYAHFLERGTIRMAPRPFMIPAGDLMEKIVIAGIEEFAKLINTNSAGAGFGTGNMTAGEVLNDPRVRSPFTKFRSFLYSNSKYLGDIAVFGGRELFGPIRRSMLSLARMTGDVSSVMGNTLTTRIQTRLRGRVIGRISGYGTASLSFSKTYSGFPGGASGHRIYSRVAGKYGTIGLSRSAIGFGNAGL